MRVQIKKERVGVVKSKDPHSIIGRRSIAIDNGGKLEIGQNRIVYLDAALRNHPG